MRHTRRKGAGLLLAALALITTGCDRQDPRAAQGFRLPDGNAEAGKLAFVELGCYVCHQVEGVDRRVQGTPPASVKLGGEVTRVRTYGELVTAIINPSHRIAPGYRPERTAEGDQSIMELALLNQWMTVQQLVDLVAFLQPTYRVVPPSYYPYTYVYP